MAQWVKAPKLQAWQPHFTPGTKVKVTERPNSTELSSELHSCPVAHTTLSTHNNGKLLPMWDLGTTLGQ